MNHRVVIGAAAVHYGRLFVAKRRTPFEAAGYWELPGDEQKAGEDDLATLQRVFNDEFSRSISLRTDRILADRTIGSWRMFNGNSVSADLRAVQCEISHVLPEDVEDGVPGANHQNYEETAWVPLDEIDSVSPWRHEDRMMAQEISVLYYVEPWPGKVH